MAAEADDERTFTVEGLLNYDLENDPSSLIGNRWVCRGSSILFIGPTGVGKSSLIMTLAVGWALVHYFRDSYSRHMRRSVDGNRQDNIGSARATRTGAQGEEQDGGGRRLQAG